MRIRIDTHSDMHVHPGSVYSLTFPQLYLLIFFVVVSVVYLKPYSSYFESVSNVKEIFIGFKKDYMYFGRCSLPVNAGLFLNFM